MFWYIKENRRQMNNLYCDEMTASLKKIILDQIGHFLLAQEDLSHMYMKNY
jgi:hypothetical protein